MFNCVNNDCPSNDKNEPRNCKTLLAEVCGGLIPSYIPDSNLSISQLLFGKGKFFVDQFTGIQADVHRNAVEKGWWEDGDRNEGELIALMNSELSEALEALRKDQISDKIPAYHGVEEELADVIIRIMDAAEQKGWRVAEAIIAKMEYNKGRSHKHGGKRF